MVWISGFDDILFEVYGFWYMGLILVLIGMLGIAIVFPPVIFLYMIVIGASLISD